jgi:hypothetical protein
MANPRKSWPVGIGSEPIDFTRGKHSRRNPRRLVRHLRIDHHIQRIHSVGLEVGRRVHGAQEPLLLSRFHGRIGDNFRDLAGQVFPAREVVGAAPSPNLMHQHNPLDENAGGACPIRRLINGFEPPEKSG